MDSVNFSALHQYSDDSAIVELVREFAGSVDDQGIVRSPGKFGGEPIHTVYFWGWMLQGEGDAVYLDCDCDCGEDEHDECETVEDYTVFHVGAGDEEAFPITLAGMAGRDIALRCDDYGFVTSWILGQEA